ncbi:hypothetical protein HON22_02590 [Candidatus Peregrinibacteria bacterium]|jgi:mRNA-degrading endonuclease RelE of RelBE toxin-antitoxin system|nr:hypothetical protein [Candidatus Peregrinibacteria bacterium]
MHKAIIHTYSEEVLDALSHKDYNSFLRIIKAIEDLEESGVYSSNTKPLRNTDKIYRKRVGRWRVLFTIEKNIIDIWIIAIEKDTKKDYNKWIKYISTRY